MCVCVFTQSNQVWYSFYRNSSFSFIWFLCSLALLIVFIPSSLSFWLCAHQTHMARIFSHRTLVGRFSHLLICHSLFWLHSSSSPFSTLLSFYSLFPSLNLFPLFPFLPFPLAKTHAIYNTKSNKKSSLNERNNNGTTLWPLVLSIESLLTARASPVTSVCLVSVSSSFWTWSVHLPFLKFIFTLFLPPHSLDHTSTFALF